MKRIVLMINEFNLYQYVEVFDDNNVIIDQSKVTMRQIPLIVCQAVKKYDIQEINLQGTEYTKKIEQRIKNKAIELYENNNLIFKYV